MSLRVNTNLAAMSALRQLNLINAELAKSSERLSSGLRINSAADDPAGLILSENLRAQIAGIEQAIRNSQDAVNFTKTAEGSMDEISKLLRDARALAVGSANNATLSAAQLQANQSQLNNIAASITRISDTASFGTKKLLDGSIGVSASLTNGTNFSAISVGGTLGGQPVVANSAVNVNVTTAATQAALTGTNAYATPTTTVAAGSFSINGTTFSTAATQTITDVVAMINQASGQTGVAAALNGSNAVVLTSSLYGANARVDLADANGIILSASGAASDAGSNAVATVTAPTAGAGSTSLAATFTGGQNGADGLLLTDGAGNFVRLTTAGNTTGLVNSAAQLIVGSAQFQIGANAGETGSVSIGDYSASALGVGTLDLTSTGGVNAAIAAIDNAIERVTRGRGDIGSFTRHTLESNVRSLSVARENLTASESMIRDTDVAEETARYTRLQILQQVGMSVLAQANLAPQAVLMLLQS